MKRTIHFPEELARQMEMYLQEHPEETRSGFIQKSVEQTLRGKNTAKLLDLVGIIADAPEDLATNEDKYH